MNGAILTLLAVFAYGMLHSATATLWAKRRARQALGPGADRLYRLFYNLIAGLTLLPVLAVPALDPGQTLYRIPWPWSLLSLAGQGAAMVLLILGVLQTDVGHFIGLRQLVQPQDDRPPNLIVSGLYRWVRHPLYTAGLLFLWLTPWMTTSVLALHLGLTAYIVIGSLFEERRLIAEFGQAYRDYQQRVPRLLPLPWRTLNHAPSQPSPVSSPR
jgi:protein-S-isoprenylcysteine O-methyltransferase Ste14